MIKQAGVWSRALYAAAKAPAGTPARMCVLRLGMVLEFEVNFDRLAHLSFEIVENALGISDSVPESGSLEAQAARGTRIPVLFEPPDALFEAAVATWTSNVDGLIIEKAHINCAVIGWFSLIGRVTS